MEFGTPSQVNIFVYVAAYLFVIAGLIWSATKPKKSKNSKKIKRIKRIKKYKK